MDEVYILQKYLYFLFCTFCVGSPTSPATAPARRQRLRAPSRYEKPAPAGQGWSVETSRHGPTFDLQGFRLSRRHAYVGRGGGSLFPCVPKRHKWESGRERGHFRCKRVWFTMEARMRNEKRGGSEAYFHERVSTSFLGARRKGTPRV